jgi:hypothetical protein
MPGGSLASKPTWWNAFGRSITSAFFIAGDFMDATFMPPEPTMNATTGEQPVYDVVVDLGDGEHAIIESGLSKDESEAANAKASTLFQGVRVVRVAPPMISNGAGSQCRPEPL